MGSHLLLHAFLRSPVPENHRYFKNDPCFKSLRAGMARKNRSARRSIKSNQKNYQLPVLHSNKPAPTCIYVFKGKSERFQTFFEHPSYLECHVYEKRFGAALGSHLVRVILGDLYGSMPADGGAIFALHFVELCSAGERTKDAKTPPTKQRSN